MRGHIGRWVGRAAIFAVLGIGFLTVSGAAANAQAVDPGSFTASNSADFIGWQSDGYVIPLEFEWN